MNKSFADIFSFNIIFISGESCKAIFKHVNSQWIIACHNDVDSQIIFKVVD
jgi:hypothetical protein